MISLIGLPAELSRVHCWQTAGGVRFALLLPDVRLIGDRAAIRASLESGKLIAFVAARPGSVSPSAGHGTEWHEQFDQQFVLVTRENLAARVRAYPRLFPAN